jgi:UDPglucose--hexose-1-phosphate uridylyltransferase
LQLTLGALAAGLNDPPFNYYIHSAPLTVPGDREYHWHLELIPKLSVAAGFELGSGMWINVVKPEEAAAFLRDRIQAKAGQAA